MKVILVVCSLFITIICFSQNNTGLKLWYNKPSGDIWENALPIGNGFLGAMIYGNADIERIQLNECTVWSGGPNRNDNNRCLDSLAEMRKLVFAGRYKDAGDLANRVLLSQTSHGQMFEPVGELKLAFKGHENFTNYYRELDIEKAVAKTSYTIGDITYTREILASLPGRVIAMHLTASKPKSISFTAFYAGAIPGAATKAISANQLEISGTTIDHETVKGMLKYKGIAKLKTEGGTATLDDTAITISNADAVTIYISIATNFNNYNDVSGNEKERAASYLDKVYPKSFTDISKAHIAAYQKYFNRVQLNLGTTDAAK